MTAEQLAAALVEFASQQGQAQPVQLMPAPYVTVALAATLTATAKKRFAVRFKMASGLKVESTEKPRTIAFS